MRKLVPRLAAIMFLALAPVSAMAFAPATAEASHCWRCKRKWTGLYECLQGGVEGNTANCVLTGGGTGCYTWGGCVD